MTLKFNIVSWYVVKNTFENFSSKLVISLAGQLYYYFSSVVGTYFICLVKGHFVNLKTLDRLKIIFISVIVHLNFKTKEDVELIFLYIILV